MDIDKDWSVNYWSERFEETRKEAEPIVLKAVFDLRDLSKLTVEEQWKLVSCLEAYASYSRLLKETLDKETPKPVPFWKKLFRK